jgi:hypothetical protein
MTYLEPSSTTSTSGLITLAGDLGGTATSPTVNKIQGITISGTPSDGYILIATSSTAASWQTASGDITLSGDVTGAANANTVVSITGASGSVPVSSSGNVITWDLSTTSPGLAQNNTTSTTSPQNITIQPQSATVGAITGAGSVIANIPASAGGGSTKGYLQMNLNGVNQWALGSRTDNTGIAAIYAQTGTTTPGATNYVLQATSSSTVVNVSSSGTVDIAVGNSNQMAITTSSILLTPSILEWGATASSPIIEQATPSSDVATTNLTIQSQAPYASASTNTSPGNIIAKIPSPVGAGTTGYFVVQNNATDMVRIGLNASGLAQILSPTEPLVVQSSNSYIHFIVPASGDIYYDSDNSIFRSSGGTTNLTLTSGSLQWAAGISSPTINQGTPTSDVATQNLTITSQAPYASASTNKNPGNLVFNIPAPVSGGTHGNITLQDGGVTYGTLTPDGTVPVVGGSGPLLAASSGNQLGIQTTNEPIGISAGSSSIYQQSNNVFFYDGTGGLAATLANNSGGASSFTWAKGSTVTLTQTTPTTDVATANFTITSQAPYASASTNKTPGSIIINIPAPVSGGNEASFQVQRASAFVGGIGDRSSDQAACLWLGNGVAPGNSNFVLRAGSGQTILSSGGTVYLRINDALGAGIYTANGVQLFSETATFGGGVGVLGIHNVTTVPASLLSGTSGLALYSNNGNVEIDGYGYGFNALVPNPTIYQTSTSSGSGATLTIQAQSATGGSNNGGNLVLAGGTSGSATAGQVQCSSQFLLKNVALSDGYSGAITTDNGTYTIYTGSGLAASSTHDYIISVVGLDSADGYVYRADFSATAQRIGSASPVFVGASPVPLNVRASSGASGWGGASISFSGDSLIVQVQGATGVTIHWSLTYNKITVT